MPAIVRDESVQYPMWNLGVCKTGLLGECKTGLMGHSGKKEVFCGTRTKNKCLMRLT
jgi:hypothetical protein